MKMNDTEKIANSLGRLQEASGMCESIERAMANSSRSLTDAYQRARKEREKLHKLIRSRFGKPPAIDGYVVQIGLRFFRFHHSPDYGYTLREIAVFLLEDNDE